MSVTSLFQSRDYWPKNLPLIKLVADDGFVPFECDITLSEQRLLPKKELPALNEIYVLYSSISSRFTILLYEYVYSVKY
jgi:hypothetical protein